MPVIALLLVPLTWAAAPIELDGRPLAICERPVNDADVQGHLGRAETHWLYLELEAASDALKDARVSMACLDTVVNPDLALRHLFLEALVALARGDVTNATRAFEEVWRLAPDASWDPSFPVAARAHFDAARQSAFLQAPASVRVEGAEGRRLWLDGRPVTVVSGSFDLLPGSHLLQVDAGEGVESAWLETAGGLLTLPASLEPVMLGGGPVEPARVEPKASATRWVGVSLCAVGGVGIVSGMWMAGRAHGTGTGLQQAALEAEDRTTSESFRGDYEDARARLRAGNVVVIGGALLTASGGVVVVLSWGGR